MEMADVSTDASASAGSDAPGSKLRKRGGGGGDDETSLNGNEVDPKKKKFDLGETGTFGLLLNETTDHFQYLGKQNSNFCPQRN